MPIDPHKLGDALIDNIASIGFEIGERLSAEVRERNKSCNALPISALAALVRKTTNLVMTDYFLGRFQALPYRISADGKSITCVRCFRTSHNPSDVTQKYCGHCKRFFEDDYQKEQHHDHQRS